MTPDTHSFLSADGETSLAFDLFRWQGNCKATVIWAHGGGFSHGSRKNGYAARLADRLGAEGIAVASLDYRKRTGLDAFAPARQKAIVAAQARTARVGLKINPNYCGAAFYAALEDLGCALATLRRRRQEFELGGPFIVAGASAGGIAALSLAYPPRDGWEDLPRPDAAFGVCAAMVQPWRLSHTGPPCVAMHGYHDGVISPHNLRKLDRVARKKGADVEVVITGVKGHRQQVAALVDEVAPDGQPWLNLLRNLIAKVRDAPEQ